MANDKVGASLNDSYDKKDYPIDIHIRDKCGHGFESLTLSEARELARDILRHAEDVERQQAQIRPQPATITDKADVLLDVYDAASRSLAGFDPALIDDTLTFQFNGHQETATVVQMQSFCDLDENDKPRKLTITLDVQA